LKGERKNMEEMKELKLDRSLRNMPRTYQIRATIPLDLFVAIKETHLLDRIDSKVTEMLYDWVEEEMNKRKENESNRKQKSSHKNY